MISCSHWGMFFAPGPIFIVPEITAEMEKELRESWDAPGHVLFLSDDSYDIVRIW
jgi:hypothetical protein